MIWADHVEAPVAEEVEKYRVELAADDGSVEALSLDLAVPQAIVPASQIEPFIIGNVSKLSVRIYQIGDHGLSEALAFEIPL